MEIYENFSIREEKKNLRKPAAKGPGPQGHNQTHIIQIYSSTDEDTGFPGCASGKRARLPMQDTKETRVWPRVGKIP